VYANPEETNPRRRIVLREEINLAEAVALRDAAARVLDGETLGSIIREWVQKGINPAVAEKWRVTTLRRTLASARLAGLREWQGRKYKAEWSAILDEDTHERLAKLFGDPSRRTHVVGRKNHLLSGVVRCGKCGRPLYIRIDKTKATPFSYGCVKGPGNLGCGGVSIGAEILEEYVTGAVLDALESPRVQQAARVGGDSDAPRRTELLAEISRAQERRAEARRDYAEGTIDKEDWLDIKQRTDDRVTKARKEYDKLTGAATVFGDIPPSDMVRDAWDEWNTDRRRAAIKAVMRSITIRPQASSYGRMKDLARRAELKLEAVRQRTEFDWRF
jgi:hypothetical protein